MQCVDQLGDEVHDMFCSNQVRAPDSEPCNSHPCDFVWVTGDWTDVSADHSFKETQTVDRVSGTSSPHINHGI